MTLWINGVVEADVETNAGEIDSSDPVYIGCHRTLAEYFLGYLDDIRIYNVALSDADIATLYAGGEPTTTPVAHWTFDDGPQGGQPANGDPIAWWEMRDGSRPRLVQATASLRPTWSESAVNSRPAVVFDGSDDYLASATALLSNAAGHVFVVAKQANAGEDTLLSQADTASANRFLSLGMNGGNAHYEQNDAGTEDDITGDTALGTSAFHVLEFISSGTAITMKVDGTAQTLTVNSGANNGDWAGDVTGADNTVLGALVASSVSQNADVSIAEVVAYEGAQAAADMTHVRQLLGSKYGITIA
jgi:hypothetical protein